MLNLDNFNEEEKTTPHDASRHQEEAFGEGGDCSAPLPKEHRPVISPDNNPASKEIGA